ncbi:MAG TPA: CBS domain-containing protein [Kofleriaceae bacterium]|jgi:CBS domain-containing protein|nr:CBS domain-containing protein [Kofleriaceae bacterium]
MATTVDQVMTKAVHSVPDDTPIRNVARMMRDREIGDVLVVDADGTLCGIVTDRDIVVRGLAEAKDPVSTRIGDICTETLVTVPPEATVEQAIKLMRERAIRRIPVVKDDVPVGILTIGDLAQSMDPKSALADISAAAPNN